MYILENLSIVLLFTFIAVVVKRSPTPVGRTPAWDRGKRRFVWVLPAIALILLVHAVVVAV